MNPYEILKQPIDTEKTRYLARKLGQYTFEVDRRANKIQVKQAVEEVFNVKVASVNIMIMPAKATKRYGRRWVVRRLWWKKAVVTLAEGYRVELYEGA